MFFHRLISELAERNKIGHMLGSNCDLKTHVQNLRYHLPLQIGGPKTTFLDRLRINGKFNGLYLRKETRHRQLVKCVDNYKGSSTSSQNNVNFRPLTASNWTAILPTLRKFSLFHCQASQTDTSKRNFAKRWTVCRANNLL